jgi:hypothetical protein
MERRRFTREFKLEAAKLVTERGVTVAQAARKTYRTRDEAKVDVFDYIDLGFVTSANTRRSII